jgi:hypothetical protein
VSGPPPTIVATSFPLDSFCAAHQFVGEDTLEYTLYIAAPPTLLVVVRDLLGKIKRKTKRKKKSGATLFCGRQRWKNEGGAKRHWRAEMRSMRRWQRS